MISFLAIGFMVVTGKLYTKWAALLRDGDTIELQFVAWHAVCTAAAVAAVCWDVFHGSK